MPPSAPLLDLTPDLEPSSSSSSPANANGPPLTSTSTSTSTAAQPHKRTLLLAPPSIAAREDRISALFAAHPRAATDLQMLDRLAAGLVALPPTAYDLVLVLTDPDGGRRAEAAALLADRAVWARLAPAVRPGGRVRSEDGRLGAAEMAAVRREAVLAGLVVASEGAGNADGFVKPEYAEEEVVPLRLGLKKKIRSGENGAKGDNNGAARSSAVPAGVGFVDSSDHLDLDAEDDDHVIDEDTLLTEEDLHRPIQQPPECQPQPGRKRRACKDCTCGLSQRLEAQDKARREKADKDLNALKLKSEDLNELDFTVPGKTGSCGSCYLGDAFRCDGCPYIGLPPFKPGEEVKILNNVAQF